MTEPPNTVQNELPGSGTDKIDGDAGDIVQTPYYRKSDDLYVLNTTTKPPKGTQESHVTPVYVFTAIFGLIFIIAPLLVRRGPNRSITRVCIMLSTVCCWIFWTTTYIVQMNPLLGPRMSNHSLAWIGYKWGHDAASLTAASMNDTETTEVTEGVFNTETSTEPVDDAKYFRASDDPIGRESADANELGPVTADGSASTGT